MGGVFHHHKDVEEMKGRRHHHTDITGDDRLGMVADKGPPALGRHAVMTPVIQAVGEVLAYRPGRHPQAKLEQQFIGKALLAPRWTVTSHAANQRLHVRWDGRSARTGLPAPEAPEPLLMAADQRVWLYNG